jgi:hypothetical protein
MSSNSGTINRAGLPQPAGHTSNDCPGLPPLDRGIFRCGGPTAVATFLQNSCWRPAFRDCRDRDCRKILSSCSWPDATDRQKPRSGLPSHSKPDRGFLVLVCVEPFSLAPTALSKSPIEITCRGQFGLSSDWRPELISHGLPELLTL